MIFSVVALIVPTVLMGGTLPVLSRFVSRQPEDLRSHLSFLYGFNTLGAVFGALLAGFFLLGLRRQHDALHRRRDQHVDRARQPRAAGDCRRLCDIVSPGASQSP